MCNAHNLCCTSLDFIFIIIIGRAAVVVFVADETNFLNIMQERERDRLLLLLLYDERLQAKKKKQENRLKLK